MTSLSGVSHKSVSHKGSQNLNHKKNEKNINFNANLL